MDPVQLINSARANMRRAIRETRANLPPAGWRWQSYCIYARRQAERFRTPTELIHSVQSPESGTGFEARHSGGALIEHAKLMERTCHEQFPDFRDKLTTFRETELSAPSTLTELNGRLVSSPLYNHIIHTLRCLGRVWPNTVLEIGGGYGAPGRVWMTNGVHIPKRYIDVDFPESLFFAEVYLRATLPDCPIVYLHAGDSFPEGNYAIALCPIANFGSILQADVDLVVNTGSMQEMSDEYVAFYMDAIERSRFQRFYSANYFAQPLGELHESMNLAAPVLGPNWVATYRSYLGAPPRGTAELFFERKAGDPVEDVEATVKIMLADESPMSPSSFLKLFDAVRRTSRPDLYIAAASAAIAGMSYVPKEALYLARMAAEKSALSKTEAALLRVLERIAEDGRRNSGVVDPSVARIRESLIAGRVPETPSGRIEERHDGSSVLIDGVARKIRPGQHGVIERFEPNGASVTIGGWAVDRARHEPPKRLHIFDLGTLVDTIEPEIRRPEFGIDSPIGFEARVSLHDPISLRIVAEFPDGTVGLVERASDK